jgi:hypothetical protein
MRPHISLSFPIISLCSPALCPVRIRCRCQNPKIQTGSAIGQITQKNGERGRNRTSSPLIRDDWQNRTSQNRIRLTGRDRRNHQ